MLEPAVPGTVSGLGTAVHNIRHSIRKAKISCAKAYAISSIARHGSFQSGALGKLPSPSPPLTRHVHFDEWGGESFFTTTYMSRRLVRRVYASSTPHLREKCQYCRRENTNGNTIQTLSREDTHRLFRFSAVSLRKIQKETSFKLRKAIDRLQHVSEELVRIEQQIKEKDLNRQWSVCRQRYECIEQRSVKKFNDGRQPQDTIDTDLFHDYPQQVDCLFGMQKVREEKAILEHNVREYEKDSTWLATMHPIVRHAHFLICRAWRFFHRRMVGRMARRAYAQHSKSVLLSRMLCYERLKELWAMRAAALLVQTYWRGQSQRKKYLAHLRYVLFMAVLRIQRVFRQRRARRKLWERRTIRDFLLKKCERLLRKSIAGWLAYNRFCRRQHWLRHTFACQLRHGLGIIRIQRFYRVFCREWKPHYAHITEQKLHPNLKAHFRLYAGRQDDISFAFFSRSIQEDARAMAWNFDKVLVRAENQFGRHALLHLCGDEVYAVPAVLGFPSIWHSDNPWPLRMKEWVFLRKQVNRAYKAYERAMSRIHAVWLYYGSKEDRQEKYNMMKSYVQELEETHALQQEREWHTSRSDWLAPQVRRDRPQTASTVDRQHQLRQKQCFFRWYQKHSDLCPNCFRMLEKEVKCHGCHLPRYAMGNASSKHRGKAMKSSTSERRRVLQWPLRDLCDVTDSNKLFLMHAGFCATVAPRYTMHQDRAKRPLAWWWNQSLSVSSGWIQTVREKYRVRTIGQLSQLSVEVLQGMQVPKRAQEKIEELLCLMRRVVSSLANKRREEVYVRTRKTTEVIK